MGNYREDRYGISWQEGNSFFHAAKGYWEGPAFTEDGKMIGGEWRPYFDENTSPRCPTSFTT